MEPVRTMLRVCEEESEIKDRDDHRDLLAMCFGPLFPSRVGRLISVCLRLSRRQRQGIK